MIATYYDTVESVSLSLCIVRPPAFKGLFLQSNLFVFLIKYFLVRYPTLGPVYSKRQSQRCNNNCDDASNTVLIENNGVAPEWGCSNSIVSMRTVSLASSQGCHSVDVDV